MRSRLLYIASGAFFIGVAIASYISISLGTGLFFALIGLSFLSYAAIRRTSVFLYDTPLFVAGLIVFCIGLGTVRVSVDGHSDLLAPYVGEKIEYIGVVSSEPEQKDVTQRFVVDLTSTEGVSNTEKILVISSRYPEYEYGDALRIVGSAKPPQNFETYAGGPIFDYVSYLYKDGIRYVVYRPKIEKVRSDAGNPLISHLYSIKHAFSERVRDAVNEPEASLLLGLLTGDKTSLGTDILDDFRRAGLSHIIVLSGYNVTIVAESLMKALSYISVAASPALGALSIILFALMTGASATTVRASVMALLFIFSRRISRRYNVSRALVFAAFIMVIVNPRILIFDVSFQLSIMATIAIIYVAPLVRAKLTFVTERFMLRDVIATTLGTQIFVLPYILHVMGTLSLVSLFSNILVLPLVPTAMFSGFITGIVGFISSTIAIPLGWISDFVLAYMIKVVHVSAAMPFASIEATLSLTTTIACYLIFVAYLIRAYKKRPAETAGRSS